MLLYRVNENKIQLKVTTFVILIVSVQEVKKVYSPLLYIFNEDEWVRIGKNEYNIINFQQGRIMYK